MYYRNVIYILYVYGISYSVKMYEADEIFFVALHVFNFGIERLMYSREHHL